jgi:hypothetical protein
MIPSNSSKASNQIKTQFFEPVKTASGRKTDGLCMNQGSNRKDTATAAAAASTTEQQPKRPSSSTDRRRVVDGTYQDDQTARPVGRTTPRNYEMFV